MKWDGERDTEEYNKKCEKQRQESFNFRNDEGVRQRLEKEDKDANDICEQYDRYELKWDGERNNKEYKQKCEEQRRETFTFSNAEDVRHRLEKEEDDATALCEKHDSYELKWDGERDNKEYKKKREEQRRESFNFCNDEGVRKRLEKEDKAANYLCKQHNSYKLKWDGECDTKEYEKKCEEQRRESLDFRNAEGVRQRLEKEDKAANNLCEKPSVKNRAIPNYIGIDPPTSKVRLLEKPTVTPLFTGNKPTLGTGGIPELETAKEIKKYRSTKNTRYYLQ